MVPDDEVRPFWDAYAQHYQQIRWSPVYEGLVKDALIRAAVRRGDCCFDLGCGPGYVACALHKRGAEVWAVDYSPEMIRGAKSHLEKTCGGEIPEAIHLVINDVNAFLAECVDVGRKADVVVANLLISYMQDWETTLPLIHRVLVDGGRLVMSNPVPRARFWRIYLRSGWNAIRFLGSAMRILSYARKIKAMEREGQFHFFSRRQTLEMIEHAGFAREDVDITTSFADTVYLTSATKNDRPQRS